MEKSLVNLYFREIKEFENITKDQEKEYLEKAKSGDKFCSDFMVGQNLKLVIDIAKKYRGKGLEFLDLIQEGNIGLIKSITCFDIKKGIKFSNYAYRRIKSKIIRALDQKSRTIKIPIRKCENIRKIEKLKGEPLRHTKQIKIFSKYLNISESEVEKYLLILNPLSLDYDKLGYSLYCEIPSKEKGPEKQLFRNNLKKDIKNLLKILTEEEEKIIENRFGMNKKKQLTLNETGKILNITDETVRIKQNKILKKLEKNGKYLKDYLYD